MTTVSLDGPKEPEVQRRIDVGHTRYGPAYVVWELTLRCDQPCTHCGSRAGTARDAELSTEEALGVVAQLKAMGTQEVAVIGGEAYLHPGFLEIVRAIGAAGIRPTMTTGGRGITAALAADMAAAGLFSVSVSVDGLERTHDLMRAAPGSFQTATGALGHLKRAGVRVTANTNLNRLNEPDLEALYEVLKGLGIEGWQVQITAPLGRAADRPEMLLQPFDLLDVVPRVAALKRRGLTDGVLLMPGNNLGYFGPEEGLLRSTTADGLDHFRGCNAGKFLMGIESNGAIKGCPSLQTAHYVGGHVREKPIAEVWEKSPELSFARVRTTDDLWGFCKTCPFAKVCMGGCTFTAHATLGRPGNNPYCHFRARSLAKLGKRERLVAAQPAPGTPFDNGRLELIEEPLDAPDTKPAILQLLKKKRWPKDGPAPAK
jgi:radical SAM protein with 4Fe4S-binding SPASM domain